MTDQIARAKPANSLFALLHDGSAGVWTRVLVSLAGALILVAFSSILAYALGALFPPAWALNSRMVYVNESIAATSFSIGGVLYLALLFWIWSRYGRSRHVWIGVGLTAGVWVVTIPPCIWLGAEYGGDVPFLIGGIVCASAGVTILLWVVLYRRHASGRPLYDETGVVNLRCPECHYSMVGLKEARCPECGRQYTLDELVSCQEFDALRSCGGRAEGNARTP